MSRPLLLALLAAPPPLWAETPPVTQVTLFEAGLAELTRDTGGSTEITLDVPRRDVDDVLKSLLILGEGITGARLTLSGPDPVGDVFATLPFSRAAASDLMTLLMEVPGLQVRLRDAAYPDGRTGRLMEARQDCATETGCTTWLTLLGDDGTLSRHAFTPELQVDILDPEIVASLGDALGALRDEASGSRRTVTVALEGEVANGAVRTVVAAPAWKTAYRALVDGAGAVDLQAWAVVENATGEDWDDVTLTLSSGSPRTLDADLFLRDWRYREGMPVESPMVVAPMPMATYEEAAGAADMAVRAAPPPAEIEAQASAEDSALESRFTLAGTIDLDAGAMLSLPYLAGDLDAKRLAVWRGRGSTAKGNPDLELEIVNDTGVRLPAGVVTVSDADGGFVGDAALPLVAPGEEESVRFGTDRKVTVEETVSTTTRRVRVTAADGVIRVTEEEARETTYLIESPSGEAREVVVDHPVWAGWTQAVQGPTPERRMDDSGQEWLRLPVEAGAELVKVRVVDTRPIEQVIALTDLDEASLLDWTEAAEPESRAYLEEAARLMRARVAANRAFEAAQREADSLRVEQARVRDLVATVSAPSAAHDRFMAQLLQLEDRLAEQAGELDAARTAADAAWAALSAHLSGG